MKVFLDTNVQVSALATRGLCTDLFRVVVAEHDLVVGEVVLEELRRVSRQSFAYPQIASKGLKSSCARMKWLLAPPIRIPFDLRIPLTAGFWAARAPRRSTFSSPVMPSY